uniref:Uncharacterized protein n=1 Tax=Romanomermis culicivorax TaxID=13658 RepID=A0A915JSP2_ROMCU
MWIFSGFCSSKNGKIYKNGEFTYYDQVGLGSCGTKLRENLYTVALGVDHWNQNPVANPNKHPLCHRCICAWYKGRAVKAWIRDKCWSCRWSNLDLSRKAFKRLESNLDLGRVRGVSFKIIPCNKSCESKALSKKKS